MFWSFGQNVTYTHLAKKKKQKALHFLLFFLHFSLRKQKMVELKYNYNKKHKCWPHLSTILNSVHDYDMSI